MNAPGDPELAQESRSDGAGAQPLIGDSDEIVRVLSFAGGGFDTVVQLGVVHALLVIEGRAPDAVVGISAGAINWAALAEIFQAGEEPELSTTFASLSHDEQGQIARRPLRNTPVSATGLPRPAGHS